MSIYKQIIFLSIVLVTVMATCLFMHLKDFEEEILTVSNKEEIVNSNGEQPLENENKNIFQSHQIPLKEEETIVEEKKDDTIQPVIETKVETPVIEDNNKSIIVEPEVDKISIQNEIDDIVEKKKIIFNRMSTDVADESFPVIESIAQILYKNPNIKIEIGGHTDAKGDDEVNKWVSEQRALSVKKELTKLGIDKTRIKAKGYGETMPKVPNDKNGYSIENRRVEFKIIEE